MAKNTSKSAAKSTKAPQKKAAPAAAKATKPAAKKPAAKPAATKSASKAVKPAAPSKKASAPAKPVKKTEPKIEPKAAQKPAQKTAPKKTQTMPSKKSEPQADAPKPAAAAETPAPKKEKAQPAGKKVTVKFPKGIFSPSTGTATSDPFSAKELDKFRVMIQDLRMENQDELEVLTEQLREMTSSENIDDNSAYSLHMAEQGTDAMEREKTFLQAQRTNDYIKKLDEALRRIQDGSFGICRICGLRLDSKRLLAVPVTQVCTIYKNTSKPCEPGRIQMEALGINDDDE